MKQPDTESKHLLTQTAYWRNISTVQCLRPRFDISSRCHALIDPLTAHAARYKDDRHRSRLWNWHMSVKQRIWHQDSYRWDISSQLTSTRKAPMIHQHHAQIFSTTIATSQTDSFKTPNIKDGSHSMRTYYFLLETRKTIYAAYLYIWISRVFKI